MRSDIRIAARTAAPIFQMYGWGWRDEGCPGEPEIAAELERMIKDCPIPGTFRCGRLCVHHVLDEEGEAYTHIELTLT